MRSRDDEPVYVIYNGPMPPKAKLRSMPPRPTLAAVPAATTAPPERGRLGVGLMLGLAAGLFVGLPLGVWVAPAVQTDPPPAVTPSPQLTEPAPLSSAPPVTAPQASASATEPEKVRRAFAAVVKEFATGRPASAPAQKPKPKAEARKPACDTGSAADRMVCGDTELARADRDLTTAYERALSNGATIEALRDGGLDWIETREAAAAESPDALAAAYRDRIAQVNALADPPH